MRASLWSVAIASAQCSLSGASAQALTIPPLLPPGPALVVTGPAAAAAPEAAPPLLAIGPIVPIPTAPPQAGAPAASPLLLTAAEVPADAPPAAPGANGPAAPLPLPLPGAAANPAPATADAPATTPDAVAVPAEIPAAPEEEPGDAEPSFATKHGPEGESSSRLSDVPIGIQPIPLRPPLIVETNDHFLSPGFLSPGIELPTGQVVRPSLWIFGTNQFGYNYFDNKTSSTKANELTDRLDLFAQLNLSGSERILFGVRPFDKEVDNKRVYTRADFEQGDFVNGTNFVPETFFFEGDFGQMFPNLDLYDHKLLDYGFSIGRQPLLIQDGLLINANRLDAISVTRNTLNGHGDLNSRTTAFFAWDQIHRNDDNYDPDGHAVWPVYRERLQG